MLPIDALGDDLGEVPAPSLSESSATKLDPRAEIRNSWRDWLGPLSTGALVHEGWRIADLSITRCHSGAGPSASIEITLAGAEGDKASARVFAPECTGTAHLGTPHHKFVILNHGGGGAPTPASLERALRVIGATLEQRLASSGTWPLPLATAEQWQALRLAGAASMRCQLA